MTLFRKFVFCATDFYLANGIPEWIFLLYGCRTNQINIYSTKGGSVKPFLGTFLLCFNFLDFFEFFGFPFHTEWNSRMDFPLAQIWSLLRSQLTPKMSCIGNFIKKLWLSSAILYFLNFFFFFGFPFHTEWNSRMDFPLAQIWSLLRSQLTPKMSCIGNFIKKLWLRSAILYFAQRIFIYRMEFQNGFSFCMDVELIK